MALGPLRTTSRRSLTILNREQATEERHAWPELKNEIKAKKRPAKPLAAFGETMTPLSQTGNTTLKMEGGRQAHFNCQQPRLWSEACLSDSRHQRRSEPPTAKGDLVTRTALDSEELESALERLSAMSG